MRASAHALLPLFLACIAFVLIATLWNGTDAEDFRTGAARRPGRANSGVNGARDSSGAGEPENQVLLRGRLLDAQTGEPVSAEVTVFDPEHPEQSSQAGADGVFQIGCDRPGRVTLSIPRSEGHFGLFQEVELSARMPVQLLNLEPRRDLPVLLRASDGRPFSQAVPPPATWTRETWPSLVITPAVAPGQPATDPLLATRVGRFVSYVGGDEARRPGTADNCVGYVRLFQAPPVTCSLVIGSRVLQSQVLDGKERMISFVVDPADLRDTHADLELRVVDADTGRPPESHRGLWLGSLGGQASELDAELDRDGRVEIKDAPAGSVELHLRLNGYEQDAQRVELQPGERNDLGLLRVRAGACLAGHVVSEAGEPVTARVWSSTREGFEHRVGRATETPAGADWFAICGLPRAIVLVGIDDPRFVLNPVEVDLGSGSLQNERLLARSGKVLHLLGPCAASGSARLRVLDAGGRCVWSGENLEDEVHELRLLPGKYAVEVRRGGGPPTRQEVELGRSADATLVLR